MRAAALRSVVDFCERHLRPASFDDWPGACNGLQVENRGWVRRLAAAVDARSATIEAAAAVGADLLVVHHGLFWGQTVPWTGSRYGLIRRLLSCDLAVYSSHLPLDAHPRWGNSVRLAAVLGLRGVRPFFVCRGRYIGVRCVTRVDREALVERLARVTGERPRLLPGGPTVCRRVGVVTGGAGSELAQAAGEGVDTFITGEGPHWTHALADELRVNVLYGGHYATETFGVKALAAAVSRRFGIPWAFVDHPTGL